MHVCPGQCACWQRFLHQPYTQQPKSPHSNDMYKHTRAPSPSLPFPPRAQLESDQNRRRRQHAKDKMTSCRVCPHFLYTHLMHLNGALYTGTRQLLCTHTMFTPAGRGPCTALARCTMRGRRRVRHPPACPSAQLRPSPRPAVSASHPRPAGGCLSGRNLRRVPTLLPSAVPTSVLGHVWSGTEDVCFAGRPTSICNACPNALLVHSNGSQQPHART